MGKTWNGENYLLFPRENIEPKFDLGLNWKVGSKWPSKSWPFEKWEEIHRRVTGEYTVSFQEGFNDIPAYIAWIQSCRTLLTHDSLGLHIGLALGKKMVALFGPTKSTEIPLENTRILSLAEDPRFACPPCYEEQCRSKIHCVGALTLDSVESEIRHNLKEQDGPVTIRRKQALTSS
jgi:heptosyltransferase-2